MSLHTDAGQYLFFFLSVYFMTLVSYGDCLSSELNIPWCKIASYFDEMGIIQV
jgi:hypothetical protein